MKLDEGEAVRLGRVADGSLPPLLQSLFDTLPVRVTSKAGTLGIGVPRSVAVATLPCCTAPAKFCAVHNAVV